MNFMIIPSLEHIALVSVAASLWNQHDVRTLVTEFRNSELFSKFDTTEIFDLNLPNKRKLTWLKIGENVIKKVSQLVITTILKEKLLGLIQAVGLQILAWMDYHHRYMNFSNFGLPNQFFWTPQGIVDKKKTAEVLVKDESIDIVTRYKFACIYCLENDVAELWNRLRLSNQNYFVHIVGIENNMQTDLLIFWWMHLHGHVLTLGQLIRKHLNLRCSAYRYMFRSAADGGNKVASEYFLQKLVPRKISIYKTTLHVAKKRCHKLTINDPPREYYSEVFCFLLSQMNNEQQVKVLKMCPRHRLLFFLEWPWQSFFVNTACRLWNFISRAEFHNLLREVINKVICQCTEYNYQKLFRELWQQSPHSHKRQIMHESIGFILDLLLEINDKEGLKLVIQDATLSEKSALIFSNIGRCLCDSNLHQFDLLKFFIQLFISSKDEMIRFKQEYEEYIERKVNRIIEHKRTEFLKLLNDLVRTYDKRKIVDEGNSSTPKRLCSIDLNDMTHDTKHLNTFQN